MKDKPVKHIVRELTHAIAVDGSFVSIDQVPAGKECECFCPACKQPLIAKNQGLVRMHHFAHQSGKECEHGYETMLHIFAKERIQEAFMKSEHFYLTHRMLYTCPNENVCKIKQEGCSTRWKMELIDLKKYYDRCEQEITYDNLRGRSDLKLYNSNKPNIKPTYIEFCVTHASDQEKLHSGAKIIECSIESEDDIGKIVNSGFIEGGNIDYYGFTRQKTAEEPFNITIKSIRFCLYPSGKLYSHKEDYNCQESHALYSSSIYNVFFNAHFTDELFDFVKYYCYNKIPIPNCILCSNYNKEFKYCGKACNLYEQLLIPQYDNFDTSRAKTCPKFSFNNAERDKVMQTRCNVPFDEVCK